MRDGPVDCTGNCLPAGRGVNIRLALPKYTWRHPHDQGQEPRSDDGPAVAPPAGVVAVLGVASGSRRCGSGGHVGRAARTIVTDAHALQRPARADDRRPDRGVHQATGIKVRVENDDEDVLTAQIEQEGSRSPADVFYTENSNWLEQLDDAGLLAKVDPSTLANVPAARQRRQRRLGRGLGPGQRAGLQHRASSAPSQLPTSVLGLADPKWKGKIELAPAETDFWPIVTSIARRQGQGRRAGLARRGSRPTPGRRRQRPRQRDARQRRQPGHDATWA